MTDSDVPCIRVEHPEDLKAGIAQLGLGSPHPTLVLVGGAGGLQDDGKLAGLMAESVGAPVERAGGCIVDGGTDAGVMHLMGCARAATGATFPLVGVVAENTVTGSGASSPGTTKALPEPHHTHFIFVPGSVWGDESPWISRAAAALAGGKPSLTLLIGGGDISWRDVAESVAESRKVVALEGTGGVADELGRALQGSSADERAERLAASGMIEVIKAGSPSGVEARITEALTAER